MPDDELPLAKRLIPWASALVRAEVARRKATAQITEVGVGVVGCAAALGLSALITYAAMTLVQLLAPCVAVLVVAMVVPLKKADQPVETSVGEGDARAGAGASAGAA
ncbi:hypothetical protein BCF44_113219 [Kutzneria buriramensis]|uniref:Uncharacterized protein n=1 Tax=Kutzneria buriramensis TaxID=1045776 RepID=A0A3E0H894_9PSEU|nr:hypothetical protein BCF44_113219 [Kutzneria buriramensis]